MSDFLVVAGIPVGMQTLQEMEPVRVGERLRAFAGGLYSQVRAEKRHWSGTTTLLTEAQRAALVAACALDANVTVVRVLDSSTITINAQVRITADITGTAGTWWTLRLDIEEV